MVLAPAAVLAVLGLLWATTPRLTTAAASGQRLVLGGAALPASVLADGAHEAIGWYAAPVEITNAGVLPVRISNPRPVGVDDGAQVSVRIQEPNLGSVPTGGTVALDHGAAAELWVTIGQPGCADGSPTVRVERGFQGVVVDVTSLGITRSVTLDMEVAAFVESGDGPLPPCA